jgi:hypothetical protein
VRRGGESRGGVVGAPVGEGGDVGVGDPCRTHAAEDGVHYAAGWGQGEEGVE